MPKPTTGKRLAEAMVKLKTSLERYIQKIASSNIRNGFCVITPTHAGSLPLTEEKMESIKKNVLEKFKEENLFSFAFGYFPFPQGILHSSKPEGYIDYEIRVGIAEFDEGWQIDQFAKGLLYCSSEGELGTWHSRYTSQLEGLRLTPLFDMALKDMNAREVVRSFLRLETAVFFKYFAKKYAEEGPEISLVERNKDLIHLHKKIPQFPMVGAPIFHAYAEARAIRKKTRNDRIKDIMNAFIKTVEDHSLKFISEVGASSATQNGILTELRQDFRKHKQPYDAERPAQGLYYFRTAQLLMLFILEFLEDPEKNIASGEIAMFIWISQHMSFEGLSEIQINDFLHMQVTDYDPKLNSLQIRDKKVILTEGLGELIRAWLGEGARVNRRWLFSKLKHEFLKDNVVRMSAKLPSFNRDLLAKDLLLKPHAMGHDALMDKPFCQHLNWQCDFVSKSPYANTINLTKQIREAVRSMLSNPER